MTMQAPHKPLRVFEHEPVAVVADGHGDDQSLSEAEAECLLKINDERPGFCQRTYREVKFAQYCGIIRLPGRTVEILPKTVRQEFAGGERRELQLARSRQILLGMLQHVPGFPVAEISTVDQSHTRMPLLEVFIHQFMKEVLAQVRTGLLSRYVGEEDNLPVVRGRIEFARQVRENTARPDRFWCAYDELTADNPYNQAIRHTLALVRGWLTSPWLQQLWLELWSVFAAFQEQSFTAAMVARLPRHRLVSRYEKVLTWCHWLLGLQSPSLLSGAQEAPALLFDMNQLFEAYVAACMARRYPWPTYSVERQGPSRFLARAVQAPGRGVFQMRPDVTVTENASGKICVIYDAKWKVFDALPAERDLYQMLAYAVAYHCMDIRLVYPWIEGQDEAGGDQALAAYTISLPSATPQEAKISVHFLKQEMQALCGQGGG